LNGLLPDLWKAVFGDSEKESNFALSEFWQGTWDKVESPYFRDRMGAPMVMEPPTEDPYEQSYDRILSIQQKGARGFRTVDIDPINVDNVQFPCSLSSGVLGNLFGFENGWATLGFGVDTDVAPFWRTIEVTANATWVRFEILPPRINTTVGQAFNLSLPGQSFGPTFVDPGTGNVNIQNSESGSTSVGLDLVVNFDDPQSSPLIVRDGDCFEIPFNTIFLTFKQWSPRFRVTFGYNTKALKAEQKVLATRPAFFGGDGLLNGSKFHYVPFSINSGDLNGTYVNTLATQEAVGLRSDTLIRNLPTGATSNLPDRGSSYIWIRRFHIAGRCLVTTAREVGMNFSLYVYGPESSGGAVVRKRKLASFSKTIQVGFVAGAYTDGNYEFNLETDELIRVRLGFGDQIRLLSEVEVGAGNTVLYWQFDLEGYSIGNLLGTAFSGAGRPITPFDTPFRFVEEQFPLDFLNEGTPGA